MLRLGDEDVLEQLRQQRWEPTFDEVSMVCGLPIQKRCAATTFFLLEWAEEAQAEKDLGKFKAIVWAITPPPVETGLPETQVEEVECSTDPSLLFENETVVIVDAREFGLVIEPRLRALATHEIGRPVMPTVLERWGLALEKGPS